MTTNAQLHVFTFKDGLLARLAHDLRLTMTRFEVSLAEGKVRGDFDLTSLRVEGVMRDGHLHTDTPSERDKRGIHKSIETEILHTASHPRASFEAELPSEGVPSAIDGELTLAGRTESLRVRLVANDPLLIEAELIPTRWGIAPFRTLGGAIKLQDRMIVRMQLSRAAPELAWPDWQTATCSWSAGEPD